MNEQEQQMFAIHLQEIAEKFAESIDRAITKTGIELAKEHPEVLSSSQMSALLMTAARRTVRGGMPDMVLFTALKQALAAAKDEERSQK